MDKPYVFMFNQAPPRVFFVPWIRQNFEKVLFKPKNLDIEALNEKEAIYIYMLSGANKRNYKGYCGWNEAPKWLRANEVTKPKIIFQADYYDMPTDEFTLKNLTPYVDAVLHCGYRKWELPVPVYYVQWPLSENVKKVKWVDFDDKEDAAVGIQRHYGNSKGSRKLAEKAGIEMHILGNMVSPPTFVGRKEGQEYRDYIALHKIGLDYHGKYNGWSRFVGEAAYAGTPVLGPEHRKGVRVGYGAFARQWQENEDIVKRLLTDKDYYEEIRKTMYENISSHLDPDVCADRYKKILEEIGVNDVR